MALKITALSAQKARRTLGGKRWACRPGRPRTPAFKGERPWSSTIWLRPGAPNWADLATSDPERARDFYGRVFGWTFDIGGEEFGGYTTALKDGESVAGLMQNSPDSGYPDGWTSYLASDDAETTAARAETAGATIAIAPMRVSDQGTMAIILDPGGAMLGLWQPEQHRGFTAHAEEGAAVWHELHTRDYRGALEFYTTVFGWQTRVESDTDSFRYTTAMLDGEQIAGVMDAASFLAPDDPGGWQLYFQVADVDATLALIESLGGTVVETAEDSPYGRLAKVTDPTGAAFKIMAPRE